MGEAEQEEKVMKEAFTTEYREKHPDANNLRFRREFVKKEEARQPRREHYWILCKEHVRHYRRRAKEGL